MGRPGRVFANVPLIRQTRDLPTEVRFSTSAAVALFSRRAESCESLSHLTRLRSTARNTYLLCSLVLGHDEHRCSTCLREACLFLGEFIMCSRAEGSGRSPEGSGSLTGPCTLGETLPPYCMPPNASDLVMRSRNVG